MITEQLINPAITELEQSLEIALNTYSNVHRGSGHNSRVTTHLYEKSRDIVLQYLQVDMDKHVLIYCTPRRAELLKAQLEDRKYLEISSQQIGLALGVHALAIEKSALPKGIPFQTGGGTTKLIASNWAIWADAPDKYEAGTPAIINVIAFAKALLLMQKYGYKVFKSHIDEASISVNEIFYTDEYEMLYGQELLEEIQKSLIGRNVQVPTIYGAQTFINFDNSASTPTFKPIFGAFQKSLHQGSNIQKGIVEEVKSISSEFFGAPQDEYEVIFTSNTTEAINLASENFRLDAKGNTEPVILSTSLEHTSNDLPWRSSDHQHLIRLKVDDDGFIDLQALKAMLVDYNERKLFGNKRIDLVAMNGASNVLGVCNDISAISQIVHQHGARLHVDAAQLAAHRSINMMSDNIDMLAFSGHKVYAPFGSGALIIRKKLLNFEPNELQLIHSSGEDNASGIAALGKAMLLLRRIGMETIQQEERRLTQRALLGLSKIDTLRVFGINQPDHSEFARKLGVIVFDKKTMMPKSLANKLALHGAIGVRYGCHCAHIIVKQILGIGPGLERFQKWIQLMFPKLKLQGVVRVSFGIENTEQDVDRFISITQGIINKSTQEVSPAPVMTKKQAQKQLNEFISQIERKVFS